MTHPPLVRLADWPERLAAYLAEQRGTVFAWGTSDCVRFAAGAVAATTGQQVLPVDWASRSDAAQQLRALGGLVPAVDSVLPRLPVPTLAQRGDVVLVQAPVAGGGARRRWLAVVDGARWWAPGLAGLTAGSMELAVLAWGVARG